MFIIYYSYFLISYENVFLKPKIGKLKKKFITLTSKLFIMLQLDVKIY